MNEAAVLALVEKFLERSEPGWEVNIDIDITTAASDRGGWVLYDTGELRSLTIVAGVDGTVAAAQE